MITVAHLKEVLHYDPVTGVWTWLQTLASSAPAGSRAGCINGWGYRIIKIDGTLYRSSRLATLYMTNAWPIRYVDHDNLNKQDDRWLNLRQANDHQNATNKARSRANTSGFKGVSWSKVESKWRAYIQVRGKSRNLGAFESPEDAHAAYSAAAVAAFAQFARIA